MSRLVVAWSHEWILGIEIIGETGIDDALLSQRQSRSIIIFLRGELLDRGALDRGAIALVIGPVVAFDSGARLSSRKPFAYKRTRWYARTKDYNNFHSQDDKRCSNFQSFVFSISIHSASSVPPYERVIYRLITQSLQEWVS